MHNANRIQLGTLDHEVDWPTAAQAIRVLPGRVVVEMLPEATRVGLIELPSTVGANLRPDVGVVLASRSEALPLRRQSKIENPKSKIPAPGTVVCVRPDAGTWIDGAEMGVYRPRGQIRAYGVYAEFLGTPIREPWWASIICEATTMRPYGDNIILRLDPVVQSESNILLANESQYRTGMATVHSVGPLVADLSPGDRVCYDARMLKEDGLAFDFSPEHRDLRICTEEAINYVVCGTQMECAHFSRPFTGRLIGLPAQRATNDLGRRDESPSLKRG